MARRYDTTSRLADGVGRLDRMGRVLVVDDDAVNLELTREVLDDCFDVDVAVSGHNAIDRACTFRPDLVLLDVMMPDMDGYETCRRLRSDVELRYTKVVLVSARSSIDDRLRGYELGADDYITKPYVPEELIAKVRVLLRLKYTEELGQMRENILLLLAHETRTPLTVINGAVDVLASAEPPNPALVADFVSMVREAAGRLGALMERSHLLCSLKNGQVRPAEDPVDVRELIVSVVRAMEPAADERGVRLELSSPPRVTTAGDEGLLRIALGSVIDNAIRCSPAGSAARVRLASGGSTITISVSDTGPGFDPRALPHIFEALSVNDITHHSRGAGLGLAISREIVRLSGGSIHVDSQPGSGATVSITLPTHRA